MFTVGEPKPDRKLTLRAAVDTVLTELLTRVSGGPNDTVPELPPDILAYAQVSAERNYADSLANPAYRTTPWQDHFFAAIRTMMKEYPNG